DRVYAAAWSGREIVELRANEPDATPRRLALNFLPDNLHWDSDGTLLVAGQKTEPAQVTRCFRSTTDASCSITSSLARIDASNMRILCQRDIPPTTTFGSGTVATPVGKMLWIGQTRGTGIF